MQLMYTFLAEKKLNSTTAEELVSDMTSHVNSNEDYEGEISRLVSIMGLT